MARDILSVSETYRKMTHSELLKRREVVLRHLNEDYEFSRGGLKKAQEDVEKLNLQLYLSTERALGRDASVYRNAYKFLIGSKDHRRRIKKIIRSMKKEGKVPSPTDSLFGVWCFEKDKITKWDDLGLGPPPAAVKPPIVSLEKPSSPPTPLPVTPPTPPAKTIEEAAKPPLQTDELTARLQQIRQLATEARQALKKGLPRLVSTLIDGLLLLFPECEEFRDLSRDLSKEIKDAAIQELVNKFGFPVKAGEAFGYRKVIYSKDFVVKVGVIAAEDRGRIKEALEKLCLDNPRHPSLRTKKPRPGRFTKIMPKVALWQSRATDEWRFYWYTTEDELCIVDLARKGERKFFKSEA